MTHIVNGIAIGSKISMIENAVIQQQSFISQILNSFESLLRSESNQANNELAENFSKIIDEFKEKQSLFDSTFNIDNDQKSFEQFDVLLNTHQTDINSIKTQLEKIKGTESLFNPSSEDEETFNLPAWKKLKNMKRRLNDQESRIGQLESKDNSSSPTSSDNRVTVLKQDIQDCRNEIAILLEEQKKMNHSVQQMQSAMTDLTTGENSTEDLTNGHKLLTPLSSTNEIQEIHKQLSDLKKDMEIMKSCSGQIPESDQNDLNSILDPSSLTPEKTSELIVNMSTKINALEYEIKKQNSLTEALQTNSLSKNESQSILEAVECLKHEVAQVKQNGLPQNFNNETILFDDVEKLKKSNSHLGFKVHELSDRISHLDTRLSNVALVDTVYTKSSQESPMVKSIQADIDQLDNEINQSDENDDTYQTVKGQLSLLKGVLAQIQEEHQSQLDIFTIQDLYSMINQTNDRLTLLDSRTKQAAEAQQTILDSCISCLTHSKDLQDDQTLTSEADSLKELKEHLAACNQRIEEIDSSALHIKTQMKEHLGTSSDFIWQSASERNQNKVADELNGAISELMTSLNDEIITKDDESNKQKALDNLHLLHNSVNSLKSQEQIDTPQEFVGKINQLQVTVINLEKKLISVINSRDTKYKYDIRCLKHEIRKLKDNERIENEPDLLNNPEFNEDEHQVESNSELNQEENEVNSNELNDLELTEQLVDHNNNELDDKFSEINQRLSSLEKSLSKIKSEDKITTPRKDMSGYRILQPQTPVKDQVGWPLIAMTPRKRQVNPIIEIMKNKIRDLVQEIDNAEIDVSDNSQIDELKPSMTEAQNNLQALQSSLETLMQQEDVETEQLTPEILWSNVTDLLNRVTMLESSNYALTNNLQSRGLILDTEEEDSSELPTIQELKQHIEMLSQKVDDVYTQFNVNQFDYKLRCMKYELKKLKEKVNDTNFVESEELERINEDLNTLRETIQNLQDGQYAFLGQIQTTKEDPNPMVIMLNQQISELLQQMEDPSLKDEPDETGLLQPSMNQTQQDLVSVQSALREILGQDEADATNEAAKAFDLITKQMREQIKDLDNRTRRIQRSLTGVNIQEVAQAYQDVQTRDVKISEDYNDRISDLENNLEKLALRISEFSPQVAQNRVSRDLETKLNDIEYRLNDHLSDHNSFGIAMPEDASDSVSKHQANPMVESLKQQIAAILEQIENPEVQNTTEQNANLQPRMDQLQKNLKVLEDALQKIQNQTIYVPADEMLKNFQSQINVLHDKLERHGEEILQLKKSSDDEINERISEIEDEIDDVKREILNHPKNNETNEIYKQHFEKSLDRITELEKDLAALRRELKMVPHDETKRENMMRTTENGHFIILKKKQLSGTANVNVQNLKDKIEKLTERIKEVESQEEEDADESLQENLGKTKTDLLNLRSNLQRILDGYEVEETVPISPQEMYDTIIELRERVSQLESNQQKPMRRKKEVKKHTLQENLNSCIETIEDVAENDETGTVEETKQAVENLRDELLPLLEEEDDESNDLAEQIQSLNTLMNKLQHSLRCLKYEIKRMKEKGGENVTERGIELNSDSEFLQNAISELDLVKEKVNDIKDRLDDHVHNHPIVKSGKLNEKDTQTEEIPTRKFKYIKKKVTKTKTKTEANPFILNIQSQIDQIVSNMNNLNEQEEEKDGDLDTSLTQTSDELKLLQETLKDLQVLTHEYEVEEEEEEEEEEELAEVTNENKTSFFTDMIRDVKCLKFEVKRLKDNQIAQPGVELNDNRIQQMEETVNMVVQRANEIAESHNVVIRQLNNLKSLVQNNVAEEHAQEALYETRNLERQLNKLEKQQEKQVDVIMSSLPLVWSSPTGEPMINDAQTRGIELEGQEPKSPIKEIQDQIDTLVKKMNDYNEDGDDTELGSDFEKTQNELNELKEQLKELQEKQKTEEEEQQETVERTIYISPNLVMSRLEQLEMQIHDQKETANSLRCIKHEIRTLKQRTSVNFDEKFQALYDNSVRLTESHNKVITNMKALQTHIQALHDNELTEQVQDLDLRVQQLEQLPTLPITAKPTKRIHRQKAVKPTIKEIEDQIEVLVAKMNDPSAQEVAENDELSPQLTKAQDELARLQQKLKTLQEKEDVEIVEEELVNEEEEEEFEDGYLSHQLLADNMSYLNERVNKIIPTLKCIKHELRLLKEGGSIAAVKTRDINIDLDEENPEQLKEFKDNIELLKTENENMKSKIDEMELKCKDIVPSTSVIHYKRKISVTKPKQFNESITFLKEQIDDLAEQMKDPELKENNEQVNKALDQHLNKAENEVLTLQQTLTAMLEETVQEEEEEDATELVTIDTLFRMLTELKQKVDSQVQARDITLEENNNNEEMQYTIRCLKHEIKVLKEKVNDIVETANRTELPIDYQQSPIESKRNMPISPITPSKLSNDEEEEPVTEADLLQKCDRLEQIVQGFDQRISDVQNDIKKAAEIERHLSQDSELAHAILKKQDELATSIRCLKHELKHLKRNSINPIQARSLQPPFDDSFDSNHSYEDNDDNDKTQKKESKDKDTQNKETRDEETQINESKDEETQKNESKEQETQNNQMDSQIKEIQESFEESINSQNNQIARLEQELSQLQKDQVDFKNQFDEHVESSQFNDLQKSVRCLKYEIKRLRDQPEVTNCQISLEEENKSLKDEVTRIEKELTQLQKNHLDLKSKFFDHSEQPPKDEELRNTFNALKEKLEKEKEVNEQLALQKEAMENEAREKAANEKEAEIAAFSELQRSVRCLKYEMKRARDQNDRNKIDDELSQLQKDQLDFKKKFLEHLDETNQDDSLDKLKEELTKHQATIDDLQNQLNELKVQERNIDLDDTPSKEDFQQLQNSQNEYGQTIEQLQKSVRCLKYEMKQLVESNRNNDLQQSFNDLKNEVKHHLESMETLTVANSDENQQEEVDSIKKIVRCLKYEMKKVRDQIMSINTNQRDINQLNEQLSKDIEDIKDQQSNNEEQEQINNKMMKSIRCVKYELKKLKESDAETADQAVDIANKFDQIKSELQEQIDQIKSENHREEENEQYAELQSKIEEMQNDIAAIKQSIEDDEEPDSNIIKEIRCLKYELKKMKEAANDENVTERAITLTEEEIQKNSELEQKIQETENQVKDLRRELNQIKNKPNQNDTFMDEVRKHLAKSQDKDQADDFHQRLIKLIEKALSQEESDEQLSSRIDELEEKIDDIDQLNKNNQNTLKKNVSAIEAKLNETASQLESNNSIPSSQLKSEIDELRSDVNEVKDQLSSIKQQLNNVDKIVKFMKPQLSQSQIAAIEKQLTSIYDSQQELVETANTQSMKIQSQKDEIDKLRSKLSETNQANDSLKNEIEALTEEIDALQTKNEDEHKEEEIKNHDVDVEPDNTIQDYLNLINESHEKLANVVNSQSTHIKRQEEELDELKSQLANKHSEKVAADLQQFNILKNELDQLKETTMPEIGDDIEEIKIKLNTVIDVVNLISPQVPEYQKKIASIIESYNQLNENCNQNNGMILALESSKMDRDDESELQSAAQINTLQNDFNKLKKHVIKQEKIASMSPAIIYENPEDTIRDKKLAELENRINANQNEIKEHQNEIKKMTELENEIKEHKNEIKKMTELENEIKEHQNEIKKMTELENEIKEHKDEIRKLHELDSLGTKQIHDFRCLKYEFKRLKDMFNNSQKDSSEIEEMNSKLNSLSELFEQVKNENDENIQKLNEMASDLNDKVNSLDLNNEIQQQNEEITKLRKQIKMQQMVSPVVIYEKADQNPSEKVDQSVTERAVTLEPTVNQQIENIQNELETLKKEFEDMKMKQVNCIKYEVKKLKEHNQLDAQPDQQIISDLTDQINQLKSQYEDLKGKQIDCIKYEVKKLKEQASTETEKLSNDFQEQIDHLKTQYEKLNKQSIDQKQLENLQSQMNSLKNDFEEMKMKQVNCIKYEIKKLKEQMQNEAEQQKPNDFQDQVKTQLDDFTYSIKCLKYEVKKLKNSKLSETSSLEKHDNEIQTIKSNLKTMNEFDNKLIPHIKQIEKSFQKIDKMGEQIKQLGEMNQRVVQKQENQKKEIEEINRFLNSELTLTTDKSEQVPMNSFLNSVAQRINDHSKHLSEIDSKLSSL